MANSIYKSKFKVTKYKSGKTWERFETLIDEIGELPIEVPKMAQAALEYDAKGIAENIETNYINYLNEYASGANGMKEFLKDAPPTPTVRITPTAFSLKNIGVNVTMTAGKKTFYYEYGTGSVGAGKFTVPGHERSEPHPELPQGYVYGGGPKVIHAGTNMGTLNEYLKQPKWYQGMATEHYDLTQQFDMWLAPMGISFGIPAGRFYYNAVHDYIDDVSKGSADTVHTRVGMRSMSAQLYKYFNTK